MPPQASRLLAGALACSDCTGSSWHTGSPAVLPAPETDTTSCVACQVQYLLQTSTLLISMKRKELRHRARQRARDEAANGKKHS